MTWRPNRRFLRDGDELIRRNHSLSFARTTRAGRYEFFIDRSPVTRKEIADLAEHWRNTRPFGEEELAGIKIRASELWQALKANSTEPGQAEASGSPSAQINYPMEARSGTNVIDRDNDAAPLISDTDALPQH